MTGRLPIFDAVGASLAAVLLAACGGASAPRSVSMTIIAPTDGATVSVRSLEVLGQVSPRGAAVSVSGQPARVSGGRFNLPFALESRVTRIVIVASASGYRTTTVRLTVHYLAPPQPPRPRAGRPVPPTTSAPYAAELAAANRVCAARNRRVFALPILTPQNVANHDIAMGTINAEVVAELRALEHPAAVARMLGPYVDFLATASAATAKLEALGRSAKGADAAKLTQQEFNRALQLNASARTLGIPACGQAALWRAGSGRS